MVSLSHADVPKLDDSPEVLRGNWYYHWGDLPRDPASGQWQYQGSDWIKTDFPAGMPGRNGNNIVWVKIDLPKGSWRDPSLFISSVDLTFEVFHNNLKIYGFGEIDAQGNSAFEGWPWHVFELPSDYAQHTLYFRIFSDYPWVGLSGEASIGNTLTLLGSIYRSGSTGLFFVLFILFVGFISTIMGVIKKDRAVALSTGLLSFNLAIMMFAENELSQVVLFEPLLWRYIAAFCYFLVPGFLAIIVLAWLKEKPPLIARIVLVISLAFAVGVAALSIFTDFNFVNAYPYFDGLFIILALTLLSGCVRQFNKKGVTGKLMTLGILALFVSLTIDMLHAHGLIAWIGRTGQWGLVFFTLASLAIYLVRDGQQQIALGLLTQELESQVRARTSELEASQDKLLKMAREDFLTGLLNRRAFAESAANEVANAMRHNRPISLLLFDLDEFKDINDAHGHAVGDLILKGVADASKATCRHGELVCRYGGEEFVILLHATDKEFAAVFANRLRGAISEIEIPVNDQIIRVSASFGLVTINCDVSNVETPEKLVERLLAEADRVMYQVKIAGKDGVKSVELKLSQI
jgi:diguanylate cyclase (GGDEF)-like protein